MSNSYNERWLQPARTPHTSSFDSYCVLDTSGVGELVTAIAAPHIENVFFNDVFNWLGSLKLYPLKLLSDSKLKLNVGPINNVATVNQINALYEFGFTLGEWNYTPDLDYYKNSNPYTVIEVYLPFYGYVNVNPADLFDMYTHKSKYLQFRLYVDFKTGQATYVLGVNDNSVPAPQAPSLAGIDDTNTRILATYVCTIAEDIPLSTTGTADAFRNLVLNTAKGAVLLGSSIALYGQPTSNSKSVTTVKRTARNPDTGRQITKSTNVKESERTTYSNPIRDDIGTGTSFSTSLLNSIGTSPATDRAGFGVFKGSPSSIKIVVKKARVFEQSVTEEFFGSPVCQISALDATEPESTIPKFQGYTEISKIHIEGYGFKTATKSEIDEIESLMKSGVFL